jgi:lipopolysaccharide transport system ATP-binding protein
MSFSILDARGVPINPPVKSDADLWVEIRGHVETSDPSLTIGYALFTDDGTLLYRSYQTDTVNEGWSGLPEGMVQLRSRVPTKLLNEGDYRLELIGGLHCRQWLFEPGAANPQLNLQVRGGFSRSPYWLARRPGLLAPSLTWEVSCEPLSVDVTSEIGCDRNSDGVRSGGKKSFEESDR